MRRVLAEKQPEELIQQSGELGQRPQRVEESDNRAEQIAQKVSGAGLSDDVQDDLVEIDLQPKEIDVKRPKDEVKNVTLTKLPTGGRGIDRHGDGRYANRRVAGGADETTESDQLSALHGELRDGERSDE